jgi:hypothetical protein
MKGIDLKNPPISYGQFTPAKNHDKAVIEYAKFYRDKIVVYPSYEMHRHNGYHVNSQLNLVEGQKVGSSGHIQAKGKRKIDQYINTWVTAVLHYQRVHKIPYWRVRNRLAFITLTLPAKQKHNDREIKKCLTRWLDRQLIRKKGVKTFLWVAEAQANGNIHFHILADRFIEYQFIRDSWNREIESLGYFTASTSDNPNSTDIHALSKIRNPSAYIVKYATKDRWPERMEKSKHDSGEIIQKKVINLHPAKKCYCIYPRKHSLLKLRPISGRVWGSSRNLAKIVPFTDFAIDYYESLKRMNKLAYEGEHFTVYNSHKGDKNSIERHISKPELKKIQKYYCEIYNFLYN